MPTNKSEAIRQLLKAEPGIAPARLRDSLAASGVIVDTHLIKVVRANWIRSQGLRAKELEEERKKDEKALLHTWKWWWMEYQFHEAFSPRRQALKKLWAEQQEFIRQGGVVSEEEELAYPDVPDLTELYVELVFLIHAGEMTYFRGLEVAESILSRYMD